MHGEGGDTTIGDLDVQVLVEFVHGGLRDGIGGVKGDVLAAGGAGHGAACPGLAGEHGRQDGVDEGDTSADVDFEDTPPGVDGFLGSEGIVTGHSCGVKEDIDGSQVFFYIRHDLLRRGRVGDVGWDRVGGYSVLLLNLGDDLVQVVLAA